jgi:hypothetical protein
MTSSTMFYEKAIGVRGVKWGADEKQEWFAQQTIKRSYQEEVISKLESLNNDFWVIERYGKLVVINLEYDLYAIKSKVWDDSKKSVLITGGIHGYETR